MSYTATKNVREAQSVVFRFSCYLSFVLGDSAECRRRWVVTAVHSERCHQEELLSCNVTDGREVLRWRVGERVLQYSPRNKLRNKLNEADTETFCAG